MPPRLPANKSNSKTGRARDRSRAGRARAVTIAGCATLAVGSLWALQGIGLLPGSFMSGDPGWLAIGVLTAAGGVALIVLGLRGGRAGP